MMKKVKILTLNIESELEKMLNSSTIEVISIHFSTSGERFHTNQSCLVVYVDIEKVMEVWGGLI